MEILNQHKTIRRFQKRAVSNEILENIINSGTRASTTGNMQLYSVVLTENKANKEKLLPLHFNQNVAKEAPVLITVIADFNRFTKWCEFNNAQPGYNNLLSFLTASIDALLLAQNICVAAENLGLGICYLGTAVYNAKEIIDILELPKLTFPITSIAIGYPDENPELADRIPLSGIIHREKYENYSKERINKLYVAKENLESSIKFVEENKVKSLAQVFTDVRYKKADNEFFSKKVLDTLKMQGFL
jgi:nitroreductase